MVRAVSTDDAIPVGLMTERIFAMLWLTAFAVASDLLHGVGVVVSQDIRSDAHYRPILHM